MIKSRIGTGSKHQTWPSKSHQRSTVTSLSSLLSGRLAGSELDALLPWFATTTGRSLRRRGEGEFLGLRIRKSRDETRPGSAIVPCMLIPLRPTTRRAEPGLTTCINTSCTFSPVLALASTNNNPSSSAYASASSRSVPREEEARSSLLPTRMIVMDGSA